MLPGLRCRSTDDVATAHFLTRSTSDRTDELPWEPGVEVDAKPNIFIVLFLCVALFDHAWDRVYSEQPRVPHPVHTEGNDSIAIPIRIRVKSPYLIVREDHAKAH